MLIRKLVRKHNDAKVENILKEFADLGRLNEISKETKPRKEISATIKSVEFVKLFESVYGSDDAELQADVLKLREIPPFTMTELQDVLKKMKNGKAQDMSHIIIEMIKHAGLPFLKFYCKRTTRFLILVLHLGTGMLLFFGCFQKVEICQM